MALSSLTVAAVYDRRFFGNQRKTGGHTPPLQWSPTNLIFPGVYRLCDAVSNLFTWQMLQVTVVFQADEFHQFCTGRQTRFFGNRPWPGVSLGVIDRDLNIHMPKIFPPETFD